MTRIRYEDALERLVKIVDRESNGMARFYVGIDGADEEKIASLAGDLAARVSGFVIPTDGFAFPLRAMTPARSATPGGAFDYERFTREVVRPFLSKELPTYGVYREEVRGTVERVKVPACGVYIVAGRYALHPEIPDFYDLRIVLDGETDEAMKTYLSAYMIAELSDIVVTRDGDADGGEEDGDFSGFSLPLSL